MTRFLLAAVLALTPLAAAAQAAGPWDARLGKVSGEVTVYAVGGDADGVPGDEDMPLQDGDRVVTGEDGSCEIGLDGTSVLTLRSGSDFTLKSTKAEADLFLSAGSLLASIAKLASGRGLRVRTPTAVAAVRGTDFGVEVEGDSTHVGVFDEGKVEVSGDAGKPELLITNQETRVARGQGPLVAYQLQRLMRHRALVRGHGRRIAALKARWKSLPPDQRLELRRKALERMRQRRQELLKKRRAELDQRQKRRAQVHQKALENQRKMEERRRRIRQGGRP